jgi:hypothetical protein
VSSRNGNNNGTNASSTATTKAGQAAQQHPAPKKRMTLNSREASMSLEDVLAARTALEMYEHNLEEEDEEGEGEHENEENQSPKKEEVEVIKTTATKRKRELEIKLPDTIDEKSEPPSSSVSSVGHDELPPSIINHKDQGKFISYLG